MTDDGALSGPVGARGASETLTSLPWFWSYLLGRVRVVRGVQRAAMARGLPPPDPALVNYNDAAAITSYLETAGEENDAFDAEFEAMKQKNRARARS